MDMRLFGTNSYSKLPDERDAELWPGADVASLEKLRQRTRWLHRHWSWRTVVLNAAGHLIVYRSLHAGRVYALASARKVTVSIKQKLALLHVVDQAGKRVTLRVRGRHAALWAARLVRYATDTDTQPVDTRRQVNIKRQDDATMQTSVEQISVKDEPFDQSVGKSPVVRRNASSNELGWSSLLLPHEESTVEKQKLSTQPSVTPQTTAFEVHPLPGGATSRSSTLQSSDTGQTVVPMRSRSLSVLEMAQQQGAESAMALALTPVQSLSAEDGGRRALFVRQLSAILQRQIDSESTACSSTSALSFSEFKTRGTVQIYRPPPSPPDSRRLCGPSPMLSADFLRELRAARRP